MKHTVQEQIEELRLQLHKIASDKDLTDPKVVNISEKLDLLINEFYIAKNRYLRNLVYQFNNSDSPKTTQTP
ncbi:MAG: aspartyl-phosphate phosphatase Spo0E family protein [Desulfosporosinus sp.]|nr:aspartyl-phosphate phosphatase Spo0E family protein [Desulfosporosinus sp.]